MFVVICIMSPLCVYAEDIDAVRYQLESGSWGKRLAIVDNLGSMNKEWAYQLLLEIADTRAEYWPIKIRAIKYLGERGDPRAIELLLKIYHDHFLHSECPSIKSYTATALGYFKDNRIIDALITGIEDSEVLIRESSIKALGKIGSPKATAALFTALKDSSYAVRLSAIQALGDIKDARAIPYLQKIAETDNDQVLRDEALIALGSISQGCYSCTQRR
jgi:HEAT repeat protein